MTCMTRNTRGMLEIVRGISCQLSFSHAHSIENMLSRTTIRSTSRFANLITRGYSTQSPIRSEILYNVECRDAMRKGVAQLARAVATTLGPKGRNVVLEQSWGAPKITKDGVTVAKHVEFSDPYMNMGAQLVRQVANKANDVAGDGTTTATILTHAIFERGCHYVASGNNPMDLKRGIDMAVKVVVQSLKEQTREISSKEEITQVATISSNGDREIGDLIATAMEKVGKEGVITVEDGNTLDNVLETVEGMRFDRGYISPYFVTDNKTMKAVLDKPLILVTDQKVSTMTEAVQIVQYSLDANKPILIIAEDVSDEVLSVIIYNKLRTGARVAAVKAPGFGDHRKNNLQDIAILTGATLISSDLGLKLDKLEPSWLGNAEKITISKDETVILSGAGQKEALEERIEQIRDQIKLPGQSDFEREKLQERLAKLSGGVAILKIGGASDVEVGEKKDRVTDALCATRAAVEEGIVAGGGSALLYASIKLENLKGANDVQNLGIKIIRDAIRVPLKTIAENAGLEGAIIVEKVVEKNDPTFGYDAQNDKFVDMFKAGIIDPTKVVRTALVDSSSVASLMTTTDCIVPKLEQAQAQSPRGGGGGGMGGMGGMGF
jgi:chaperonin GroEL